MQELTLEDFVEGLICGLRLNNVVRVGYDDVSWSQAVAQCYFALEAVSDQYDLELCFLVIPHSTHGDSPTAIQGLRFNQDLAPFEAPLYDAFSIRVSEEKAEWRLRGINPPLPIELWRELARTLDDCLNANRPLIH